MKVKEKVSTIVYEVIEQSENYYICHGANDQVRVFKKEDCEILPAEVWIARDSSGDIAFFSQKPYAKFGVFNSQTHEKVHINDEDMLFDWVTYLYSPVKLTETRNET